MHNVKLGDHVYRIVRLNDSRIVIEETGPRTSRPAPPAIAAAILAGNTLRVVS